MSEAEREERGAGGAGGEGGGEARDRRRDVDGKRERSVGRRREREALEREGGSQGGRIESYASTVLQPEEDKMRKTLGLSVYSAKYSSPLRSEGGWLDVTEVLRACLREPLRITACVSLWTVRVSCLCACPLSTTLATACCNLLRWSGGRRIQRCPSTVPLPADYSTKS